MIRVGIRELRQRASELLRLVETGETIEVTDRGRPVAILGPVPDQGPLERLRAAGEITRPTVAFADLPAPWPLQPDEEPPSAVLERLRRDER